MRYRVGDKVRVIPDLKQFKKYNGQCVSRGMMDFINKEGSVTRAVSAGNYYTLSTDDDYFIWTDDMLEPVDGWTPKSDDNYYVIDLTCEEYCHMRKWTNSKVDHFCKSRNLIFRTKEDAVKAANQVLDLLRTIQENGTEA